MSHDQIIQAHEPYNDAITGEVTRHCCQQIGERTQSLRRAARRLLVSTSVACLPIDVYQIADDCGLIVARDVDVLNEQLPACVNGLVHEGWFFDSIIVNTTMSDQEQRFVVGHEIAEWHLGHEKRPLDTTDYFVVSNQWKNGILDNSVNDEVKSDVFSLELMVPMPLFATELLRLGPDIDALAEVFDVDPFMILIKFWLNGIEPDRYDEFEATRWFREKVGPWGRMLYERVYHHSPVDQTRFPPGLPVRDWAKSG